MGEHVHPELFHAQGLDRKLAILVELHRQANLVEGKSSMDCKVRNPEDDDQKPFGKARGLSWGQACYGDAKVLV